MPPTADNSIVGHRSSLTFTTTAQQPFDKNMRTLTMMSGDNTHQHHNGFPSCGSTHDHEHKSSKYDFFYKEPCLYTHKVYANAAKVFSCLKHESKEEIENPYYRKQRQDCDNHNTPTVLPDLDFEDDAEKRLTFELAFETLKCK